MKYLGNTSSGSQADTTYARNRYGQYQRRRATPVNRNTTYQQRTRVILAETSTAWSGLTGAQRGAWEAWAAAHPITDSLGQDVLLDGHAFFVRVNSMLLGAYEASVLVPPANEPTWFNLVISGAPSAAAHTFPITFSVPPVNYGIVIRAGPPRPAGRTFESDWKFVGKATASSTSPLDIGPEYLNRWGTFALGSKIFWQSRKVWWSGAWTPWTGNYSLVGA